jgi:CTP:molybdopterin cytidylyltransferase MocA
MALNAPTFADVILVAGGSPRMVHFKPLLPVDGPIMISHMVIPSTLDHLFDNRFGSNKIRINLNG